MKGLKFVKLLIVLYLSLFVDYYNACMNLKWSRGYSYNCSFELVEGHECHKSNHSDKFLGSSA